MYAVWLIFSQNDTKYLKKIITNIAKKYDAPEFEPHITIYGILDIEINLIKKILKKIARNNKLIISKNIKILQSNNLWKTIYIELENQKEFTKIYQDLKEYFKQIKKYEFNPHISLVYKILSTIEKTEIINQLDIKKEFTIEQIAILKFFPEIEKWEIIEKYDLQ
jgi:2'-5' RNA ligase